MLQKAPVMPPAGIAVIGLGNMGTPMALCLSRVGFYVTGHDLSEEARQRFSAAGGRAFASANDAAKSADVVIAVLPDGNAVRATFEPLRKDLKPHCVLIDMSSSEPVGTRALGQILIAAGFGFLDAPVSGGVKRAIDGTLAIMVGGDAATIDRVMRVLSAMGQSVFRTGVLGSGHAMKALNNYVSAAGLVAAVEAIRIGEKFGIDPNLMADIFNASTGRNNTTEMKLKQFIISGSFNSGFPLRLMTKDVRTADGLGHKLGVAIPFADACTELWEAAARALDEKADHTEIGRYIEKLKV